MCSREVGVEAADAEVADAEVAEGVRPLAERRR